MLTWPRAWLDSANDKESDGKCRVTVTRRSASSTLCTRKRSCAILSPLQAYNHTGHRSSRAGCAWSETAFMQGGKMESVVLKKMRDNKCVAMSNVCSLWIANTNNVCTDGAAQWNESAHYLCQSATLAKYVDARAVRSGARQLHVLVSVHDV